MHIDYWVKANLLKRFLKASCLFSQHRLTPRVSALLFIYRVCLCEGLGQQFWPRSESRARVVSGWKSAAPGDSGPEDEGAEWNTIRVRIQKHTHTLPRPHTDSHEGLMPLVGSWLKQFNETRRYCCLFAPHTKQFVLSIKRIIRRYKSGFVFVAGWLSCAWKERKQKVGWERWRTTWRSFKMSYEEKTAARRYNIVLQGDSFTKSPVCTHCTFTVYRTWCLVKHSWWSSPSWSTS